MDPDALMEIKTQLTSLGRNSNPMLTIYASVLREEALKSKKQRPRTEVTKWGSFGIWYCGISYDNKFRIRSISFRNSVKHFFNLKLFKYYKILQQLLKMAKSKSS